MEIADDMSIGVREPTMPETGNPAVTKPAMSNFPAIIDLSGYTEKMRKSFLDKTFFLEKIDATVIIDYGCADGSMIEFMWKMFPEYHYFGYDIDPKMIALAKKKEIKATFTTDFDIIQRAVAKLRKDGHKSAVVCSSIIHEIYSYKVNASDEIFWRNVMMNWFDYVVIRDMAIDNDTKTTVLPAGAVWKIANYYLDHKDDSYILRDFQKKWGPLTTVGNLVHFLLKYRYKNNWERELNENYLPLTYEELVLKIEKYGTYNQVYENHFTLPWLIGKVEEDFQLELEVPTHIKLIYKRK